MLFSQAKLRMPRKMARMNPPAVAAPRGASLARVDARADVYALGCTAWFLLVGRPPFLGQTAVEVYAADLHEAPPRDALGGVAFGGGRVSPARGERLISVSEGRSE
jgi:serine/threonine protein kinase